MKELFEQNKVLFLAVITALIIAFLIKKLIDYITRKGLEGIRLYVYELFVESEERFKESGQGQILILTREKSLVFFYFQKLHNYFYR